MPAAESSSAMDTWGEKEASEIAASLCKPSATRSTILHKLGSDVLLGAAPPSAFADVFSQEGVKTLAEADAAALASDVGDVLWLLGLETEGKDEPRKLLVECAKPLVGDVVSSKVLQERLEGDLLVALGVVRSEKALRTRMIRQNTRNLYTQTKYNLFQEESEGYAKLVEVLNSSPTGKEAQPKLAGTVRSLIGQFDLDPNRVFDLILDALEHKLHEYARFMPLFDLFNANTLRNLLGFKFQRYHSSKQRVPRSLYNLTAFLISKPVITLSDIFPHLHPQEQSARDAQKEYHSELMSRMRKVEFSSNMKGGDESEAKSTTLSEQITVPKSKMADIPFTGVAEDEENQKLGLLVSMLQMHDWKTSNMLLSHLRWMQPAQHADISKALCQRANVLIHPLYSKLFVTLFAKEVPALSPQLQQASKIIEAPETYEELVEQLLPLLYHLGPFLKNDVLLMTKVLRIIAHVKKSTSIELPLDTLLSRSILPALSLVPMNPNVANAVWDLVSDLPYTQRYQAYGQWYKKGYNKHPVLKLQRCKVACEVRKVAKRISTDAGMIKKCGKIIGKLSHANPCIVFHELLTNVERSPNMVQPTVDSLKYISPLGHDVLTFLVLDHLSQSKSKMKSDGKHIEEWLGAVAAFCGLYFRKFPSTELAGVLQYVVNQLKDGNFVDLVVLHELISKMAGIEINETGLTRDHIEARAGGECLKATTVPQPTGRNAKRTIKYLKDALVKNDLVVPLLVLMAQTRSRIIYEQDIASLKVLSQMFDKCHATLVQYTEFILTHVTPHDKYAKMMPSMLTMCSTYHLDLEVVFSIMRPVLPLIYKDAAHVPDSQADVAGSTPNYDSDTEPATFKETVLAIFPVPGWESMAGLFGSFWSLSLYDIFVPNNVYAGEIKKQQQQLDALPRSERDGGSRSDVKKKRDFHSAMITQLKEEQKAQRANHVAVLAKLQEEKDQWLANVKKEHRNEIIVQFLQTCVLPRCKFSVTDALYCARFVRILHQIGTPFFSTLQYFEKVTKDVASMIFSCTESEANRFGAFLSETLSLLHRWRSDEKVYLKECEPQPGFATSFSNPDSPRAKFSDFSKVSFKWYCRLVKSFCSCLESSEYLEIRNALIVLSKIVAHFPILRKASVMIREKVQKLSKTEKRNDLKVLASSYLGQLELSKNNLLTEAQFKNEPGAKRSRSASPVPPPKLSRPVERTPNNDDGRGRKERDDKPPSRGGRNTPKATPKGTPRSEIRSPSGRPSGAPPTPPSLKRSSSRGGRDDRGHEQSPLMRGERMEPGQRPVRGDRPPTEPEAGNKRRRDEPRGGRGLEPSQKKRRVSSDQGEAKDGRPPMRPPMNRDDGRDGRGGGGGGNGGGGRGRDRRGKRDSPADMRRDDKGRRGPGRR